MGDGQRLRPRRPPARSYAVSLTVGPFGPVVWHMAPKSGCLLLVFSMSAAPVDAHDIYMHLKTPLGFHCCTGQDCRPARLSERRGWHRNAVDNRWLPVAGYDVMYRSLPEIQARRSAAIGVAETSLLKADILRIAPSCRPTRQPRMCRSERHPTLTKSPSGKFRRWCAAYARIFASGVSHGRAFRVDARCAGSA